MYARARIWASVVLSAIWQHYQHNWWEDSISVIHSWIRGCKELIGFYLEQNRKASKPGLLPQPKQFQIPKDIKASWFSPLLSSPPLPFGYPEEPGSFPRIEHINGIGYTLALLPGYVLKKWWFVSVFNKSFEVTPEILRIDPFLKVTEYFLHFQREGWKFSKALVWTRVR